MCLAWVALAKIVRFPYLDFFLICCSYLDTRCFLVLHCIHSFLLSASLLQIA